MEALKSNREAEQFEYAGGLNFALVPIGKQD